MSSRSIAINGDALRQIRKLLGLRTETLAEEVGLSYSMVASIENGNRRSVSPEVFKKLCIALRLESPRAIIRVPDTSAIHAEIKRLVDQAPELSADQKAIIVRTIGEASE